jgi:hypothetical protein
MDTSTILVFDDQNGHLLDETATNHKNSQNTLSKFVNQSRLGENDKPKYGSIVTNMRKSRILNATLKRIMNTNK